MTQPTSEMAEVQTSKTDVIRLLVADHQRVKNLFQEFKALKMKMIIQKKRKLLIEYVLN